MKISTLELAVGGLPYPHGREDGSWAYRHAVRPEGHSAIDAQSVADFIAYETAHGREVSVTADPELADWETWSPPSERVAPGAFAIQCCTHAYPEGCGSSLVCHGAPSSVASRILEDGVLLSASQATGRDGSALAAESTWGEPADYFDHVMLANGRCTAPEAVALSRALKRDLEPLDLRPGYPPAVRFYFGWKELAMRDDARFDGVHPVKIAGSLALEANVIAVVMHSTPRETVDAAARSRFAERLVVLDLDDPLPHEWAAAANDAALRLQSKRRREVSASASFVPADFEPPTGFTAGDFRLEPLGPEHNERDYDAWMSSIEHIRSSPGYPDGNWPRPMSLDENRADLERHARHFVDRKGFTYTVLDSSDDVVGCVYVYPSNDGVHDATVQSWVRESKAAVDEAFRRTIADWLTSDAWPFERPLYTPLLT